MELLAPGGRVSSSCARRCATARTRCTWRPTASACAPARRTSRSPTCPRRWRTAHAAGVTRPRRRERRSWSAGDLAALPDVLPRHSEAAGVDAVIVGDLGAASHRPCAVAPRVALHVSTRRRPSPTPRRRACGTAWVRGASCAPARCRLDEIARLRADAPADLEIEAFAHGAHVHGGLGALPHQLLSDRPLGQPAVHCTQPCRWSYTLEEEKRPGEHFPIEEDGRGTFIMNAKDMNMLAHLARAGGRRAWTPLKIEGPQQEGVLRGHAW